MYSIFIFSLIAYFQVQPGQLSADGLAKREATLQRLIEILDLAAEEGCGLVFDKTPPTFVKRTSVIKSLPTQSSKIKPK